MESKTVFFCGSIDPGYFVHMMDEELPCYAEKNQTWNQDPKPVAENLFYLHTPYAFAVYVGRFFRDGLIFLGGNFLNRTSPLPGQSFLVAPPPPQKKEINSFATLSSLPKKTQKKVTTTLRLLASNTRVAGDLWMIGGFSWLETL